MEENRMDRMKRRLLGRRQALGDGERQKLDRVLADGAVLIFYYLGTVLLLISLVVDAYTHQRPTASFGTLALLGMHLSFSVYVIRASRKAGLSESEQLSSSDHALALKQLKRGSLLSGFGWGVSMTLLMNAVLPWVAGQPVKQDLFPWLIWLVGGALLGWIVYRQGKRQIKLV
ncbi:MAG: DUF3278 domain-containing protein [Lautropia sp.]|nr:DUF3278 domain-containing protein [Lautropia sp.]